MELPDLLCTNRSLLRYTFALQFFHSIINIIVGCVWTIKIGDAESGPADDATRSRVESSSRSGKCRTLADGWRFLTSATSGQTSLRRALSRVAKSTGRRHGARSSAQRRDNRSPRRRRDATVTRRVGEPVDDGVVRNPVVVVVVEFSPFFRESAPREPSRRLGCTYNRRVRNGQESELHPSGVSRRRPLAEVVYLCEATRSAACRGERGGDWR